MDWLGLLSGLLVASAVATAYLAWLAWYRRYAFRREWPWFVSAVGMAALWALAQGLIFALREPRWLLPLVLVRNIAADFTAITFLGLNLIVWWPERRTLWLRLSRFLGAFYTILELILVLTFPWEVRSFPVGGGVFYKAEIQGLHWAVRLIWSLGPWFAFLVGLGLLVARLWPIVRQTHWAKRTLALVYFTLMLTSALVSMFAEGHTALVASLVFSGFFFPFFGLLLNTMFSRLRFGFMGPLSYETVSRAIDEGVLVFDLYGQLIWWNPAAQQLLALHPQDYKAQATQVFAAIPGLSEHLQQDKEQDLLRHFLSWRDAQGKQRFAEVSWLPIREIEERPSGYLAIFHDLTLERRLQEALRVRVAVQEFLNRLLRLLLETRTLNELLDQAARLLVHPMEGVQIRNAAIWARPDLREEALVLRAQRGNWTWPLPQRIPWPLEAPWDEARFRAALGPIPQDACYLAPLRLGGDRGRLVGVVCLGTNVADLAEPIRDALGFATRLLAHMLQRRLEEERLLQLQQVYESMQEAVLILSPDGHVIDANIRAETLFGYPVEALWDGLLTGHRVRLEPGLADILPEINARGEWFGLWRLYTADNPEHARVLEASAVRVRSLSSPDEAYIIVVLRDITERQRLQEALQAERERLSTLLDLAYLFLRSGLSPEKLGYQVLRSSLELTRAQWGTLFVLDQHGTLVRTYTPDGMADDPATLEAAEYVLRQGAAGYALRHRTPLLIHDTHSDERWLNLHRDRDWRSALVMPLFYQDQPAGVLTLLHQEPHHFTQAHMEVIAAAADLLALSLHNAFLYEELYRLSRELMEAKERAESLRRRQEQFFANLSHDMRTPLQAILGHLELLRMEYGETEAPWLTDLQMVEDAAKELYTMVSQILEYRRSQASDEVILSEFPVRDVVQSVVHLVTPLIRRNANRLVVEGPPDNLTMYSDKDKVRHILLNLLVNAARFTRDGVVRLRVWHEQTDGQDEVVFEVADTGIGIPADKLNRIFEPFEQVDPQRSGGTGLGLAIVKDYVQRLGGAITVESELGRGSTFTVRLPRIVPSSPKNGNGNLAA